MSLSLLLLLLLVNKELSRSTLHRQDMMQSLHLTRMYLRAHSLGET